MAEITYIVKTFSQNNEMNLHSINKAELSTTSLDEAYAMYNKEVETLNATYVTLDSLPYSPSDAECANAVVCELMMMTDCDGDIVSDTLEISDYYFEKY